MPAAVATEFSERLKFRCPPALVQMVEQAATREMTSTSEYLRRAALEKLRADGIAPGPRKRRKQVA